MPRQGAAMMETGRPLRRTATGTFDRLKQGVTTMPRLGATMVEIGRARRRTATGSFDLWAADTLKGRGVEELRRPKEGRGADRGGYGRYGRWRPAAEEARRRRRRGYGPQTGVPGPASLSSPVLAVEIFFFFETLAVEI